MHVNLFPGFGVDPSPEDTPAGKYQSVRPVARDDGEFEVAVKGRDRYAFPHARPYMPPMNAAP